MNESPASLQEGVLNPETGKAPERRFINPKDRADGEWIATQISAFSMVGNVKDRERQEVEAMLRHAPPYSEADLKALNMENSCNSTMGELPRRVSDDEAKWTDYVVSASGLWEITFPDLPGEVSDALKEQVSGLINQLWMDDPRHVLSTQLCFRQFSTYGIGPIVFTDCYDPTPIARIASDLKFNPGTRLTLDNFSECSLKDTCLPQELYSTIRGEVGEKRAKLHGWNRAEVMKVLKANARNDQTSSPWSGSLEDVELQERRGENIWKDYSNKEIRITHVFVREYEPDDDGKLISHLVLASDGTKMRIIRDKGYEYKTPWNFLMMATDRVGSDMTIAGLRGTGIDLLEHCRSMDISHCASMYAGFRSSIPVYTCNGGNAAQSADQVSVRPNGVVIPNGFTEVKTQVDFQAGGWLIDRLSNLADRYQNKYDINSPNKGGVQRTASESKLDAAKESDSRSNQVLPIVRLFFEPLGREFTRRLFEFPGGKKGTVLKFKGWELAEQFWKKLTRILNETGVPVNALDEWRVTINPNNTPNGLDKKMLRNQAMMPFYGLVQTQEQRNWIVNSGLVAIAGYQASKPFLNKNENRVPMVLEIQIDSENADMVSGYQRRVLPEQDHLRHMGPLSVEGVGHVPFAMQKLGEIQQGVFDKFSMDALDALSHQLRGMVTIKGHMDAHLALLAQNPTIMDMPEVQGYFDFAAQLEQILVQSIDHFEKQMAERDPASHADPKTQAVLAKTRAEIESIQMRTQNDIQMAQQKQVVKLGNVVQTNQARHASKNAEFILSEMSKKMKAESDMMVKQKEAALALKTKEQQLAMEKKAAAEASSV